LFLRQGLTNFFFAWADLKLWSFYLYLLHSQNYRSEPLYPANIFIFREFTSLL
jgi:hypothetical protein